ncbi:MAG TPA: hypothetical protein VK021_05090 [Flavobacteriaceae bacterium]|nr:hypothetical protein [Flavobacteriaceae bacterium]
MNNKLIYYEKAGDIVLGEIIENSPTEIKIKILYPFYGISLTAKPKMCMLFSDKTYNTMGVKVLERCFHLGKIISRRSQEIIEDFIDLEEKLKTIEGNESSGDSKAILRSDFRILYLNGFKDVPELTTYPLEGLLEYLKKHLDVHPHAEAIRPETKYSKHSKTISNKLREIKEGEINSY